MSERSTQLFQCEIAAVRVLVGRGKSGWVFEAQDPKGTVLNSTTPFKSQSGYVHRGSTEFNILSSFLVRVQREGWTIVFTPPQDVNGDWFKVRLAKGSPQDIQSMLMIAQLQRPVIDVKSPWLTAQKMWIFSVLILFGLVACCLLLIFTSELRFSPA